MFCKNCGLEIAGNPAICPHCGKRPEGELSAEKIAERKTYTPIGTLTRWVIGVFILFLVLEIIAIISGYLQVSLVNRIASGAAVSNAEASANDAREAMIAVFQWVFYVVSGIFFLIWVYRADKNLYSLTSGSPAFSPGWAVGWWFVPIASLFQPYRIMREILRVSDPTGNLDGTSTTRQTSSTVVGIWWSLFIFSNIISRYILMYFASGKTLSQIQTLTYVYLVVDIVEIIGITVTILMIRKIAVFQYMKSSQIATVAQAGLAW